MILILMFVAPEYGTLIENMNFTTGDSKTGVNGVGSISNSLSYSNVNLTFTSCNLLPGTSKKIADKALGPEYRLNNCKIQNKRTVILWRNVTLDSLIRNWPNVAFYWPNTLQHEGEFSKQSTQGGQDKTSRVRVINQTYEF